MVGLARSGRSAAQLLARAGADVYASDAASSDDLEATAKELRVDGVGTTLASTTLTASRGRRSWSRARVSRPRAAVRRGTRGRSGYRQRIEIGLAIPAAPAVHRDHGHQRQNNDDLAHRHLLNAVGRRAATAGNIGTPLCELAASRTPPSWVALEISSFQLHDTPSIEPTVGVLTNLSANHLDRYTSVDEYFGDKMLMFRNAKASSSWVTNADDPDSQRLAGNLGGLHCRFSVQSNAEAYLDRESGMLVVLGQPIIARDELPLLGDHNVANALAALLSVMLADREHRTPYSIAQLRDALRRFHALEHRIETVAERDGVVWINDSKSTNVTSTVVAMQGMTRPTVLLLGGKHKGEPYTALASELRRIGRAVIAYGEAAPLIEADLTGVVPLTRLGSSFEDVVATARRLAQPGDAVLLSPACSSYDMFDNYEHRGAVFKQLVVAA